MVFRGARAGRPGLLGAVARTAVITGTAQATSNAMNRRNQRRMADQQTYADPPPAQQAPAYAPPPPAAAPAPPPPPTGADAGADDLVSKLTRLGDLHSAGVLSDQEFEKAKAQLLGP